MSGTYHLVALDARYRTRRVLCYRTGRHHRHKTHQEQYTSTLCGQEVLRSEGTSCSEGIADPRWDKDWCHDCVRSAPWRDDVKGLWRAKGIEVP